MPHDDVELLASTAATPPGVPPSVVSASLPSCTACASPGSDRSASQWLADQAVDGAADLRPKHIGRAIAWLGEELP